MLKQFRAFSFASVDPCNRAEGDRVREARLECALRLTPWTAIGAPATCWTVAWSMHGSADAQYLATICVVMSVIGGAALGLSLMRFRRASMTLYAVALQRALTVLTCAGGVALGTLPIELFAVADADQRLLIAATMPGLMAGGISFFSFPVAAIGFTGSIIAASFWSLASTGEPFYQFVGVLLTIYGAYILFTIIDLYKILRARILSELEIVKQRDVVRILLNDFEENGSDWIWEVDAEWRLRDASPRLAEIMGVAKRDLEGIAFADLLNGGAGPDFSLGVARRLGELSANRSTFRDLVLPVRVKGNTMWWSLSGKPEYAANGSFDGFHGVGTDVTTAKRAEERLSYLARYDQLTGLPNRETFRERLTAVIERQTTHPPYAVLLIDIDEFKFVNDSFGHLAGDAVLVEAGRRFAASLGEKALVARLAGDEFAALLVGVDEAEAAAAAGAVVDTGARRFEHDGRALDLRFSVGVALSPAVDLTDVLRRADLALYRAKNEGRNGFRFFDLQMAEAMANRRAQAADLRGAAARGELELHFQPIVGARDGKVVAREALLRWRHPVRGLVPPAQFIPIAEENGEIVALGEWALRTACRTAAGWADSVSVSVNLSPVQFRFSEVDKVVVAALTASGLNPRRLVLEVTETVMLEKNLRWLKALRRLQRRGVRVALDDFGTGYSSLGYLRRMPFDSLKIDRAFVRDLPENRQALGIARAIVTLANELGMSVVAEGVEDARQAACLREIGCHSLQGYFFGRPSLEVEDAEAEQDAA